MTANEAFNRCWSGDPADVQTAWLRAEQSARMSGNTELARKCRINYICSLRLIACEQTFVDSKGRLRSKTIQTRTSS